MLWKCGSFQWKLPLVVNSVMLQLTRMMEIYVQWEFYENILSNGNEGKLLFFRFNRRSSSLCTWWIKKVSVVELEVVCRKKRNSKELPAERFLISFYLCFMRFFFVSWGLKNSATLSFWVQIQRFFLINFQPSRILLNFDLKIPKWI